MKKHTAPRHGQAPLVGGVRPQSKVEKMRSSAVDSDKVEAFMRPRRAVGVDFLHDSVCITVGRSVGSHIIIDDIVDMKVDEIHARIHAFMEQYWDNVLRDYIYGRTHFYAGGVYEGRSPFDNGRVIEGEYIVVHETKLLEHRT